MTLSISVITRPEWVPPCPIWGAFAKLGPTLLARADEVIE